MSQTYRVTLDEPARKLAKDLLDMSVISGGRAEGRRRERAHAALDGEVYTIENAETILGVVEESMKESTTPDGRRRPGTLTGAGFRILSTLIKRLEAVKEGDLSISGEGVEAIAEGGENGKSMKSETSA